MPVALLLGIVGVITLLGGLCACVAAVRRWRREKHSAVTYASAVGRIVERYLPPGSSNYAEGPRYTIDFPAPGPRTVRFTTDSVGWRPKNVEDSVEVLYDASDPNRAIVRGGERVAAVLFAIAGVVFTLVGLLLALSAIDLGSS